MIFSQQEGLVSHYTFSVLVDDTHGQTPSVLVMIYEEKHKRHFYRWCDIGAPGRLDSVNSVK